MKFSPEMGKYAGMASQFLIGVGLGVALGIWLDKFIGWHFPLFTILLPLIIIFSMLFKIYRDTLR